LRFLDFAFSFSLFLVGDTHLEPLGGGDSKEELEPGTAAVPFFFAFSFPLSCRVRDVGGGGRPAPLNLTLQLIE